MTSIVVNKVSFIISQKGNKMLNVDNVIFMLNLRISKYHLNIWAFIRCIQGEEHRFNRILIPRNGGLAARPQTKKKTAAIQQIIDTLYARHDTGDITRYELLQGLTFVVAKNIKSKRK